MPVDGDRELVSAVLRRDRKATAEFVSLHADALYAYVHHRLFPWADLAEDVVQEIFLAAWQRLSEFRGESTLRSWLLGIARHKVEDHYRARLRGPLQDDAQEIPELQFDPHWDELLDREALEARIRRAMASLPEDYRVALLWRYWDKRSTQEMALMAGKTEKGMERLLARAREQFKRRWDK